MLLLLLSTLMLYEDDSCSKQVTQPLFALAIVVIIGAILIMGSLIAPIVQTQGKNINVSIPFIVSLAWGVFVLWYCSAIISDYDDKNPKQISSVLKDASWVALVVGLLIIGFQLWTMGFGAMQLLETRPSKMLTMGRRRKAPKMFGMKPRRTRRR